MTEAVQQRTVMADGAAITYTLIRKNVKNINLRVKDGGIVNVSAGFHVPAEYVDDFVRSRSAFITEAAKRFGGGAAGRPGVRQYQDGEQIPYLGRLLTLRVEPACRRLVPEWIQEAQDGDIECFSRNGAGDAVFIRDGCLYVYTESPQEARVRRELVESWEKIHAGVLCRQLSARYYPFFGQMGVAWPRICIRRMTSRWGSCIPAKQKITFNSLLLEQPLEGVEYVVVHEFAHFIHPDHSQAFYQLVAQVFPDYKRRRALLTD